MAQRPPRFQAITPDGVTCGHKHKTEASAKDCTVLRGVEGVTIKTLPGRFKSESRAERYSGAQSKIESAANALQELASEIESDLPGEGEAFDASKFNRDDIQTILDGADADRSDGAMEIQSLYEEIENWKSGMEGTNLEQSMKYGELEECLSELETANEADGVTIPSLPDGDLTQEALEDFVSELESAVSELENCYQAEPMFPGMY
jgi:hypothetical protein